MDYHAATMPASTLLLAADGSPASDRAVELLAGYRGDAARTEVAVLNVQARPLVIWRTAAAVRLGFAAGAILREAEARNAGMIVMGTRGHGAVRGFALGSVAMRAAHASPLPVCLVTCSSRSATSRPCCRRTTTSSSNGARARGKAPRRRHAWR